MKRITVLLTVLLILILTGCQHPAVPQTSSVEPPAQTEEITPATQTNDQMPVLEVAWEEIKLPPLKYGYDDISGFLVENGGRTISVYRCIGPANNGKATLYSYWQTTDGGQTWNEVEQVILNYDQEKQLGFIPAESSWGYNDSILLVEDEVLQQSLNPLVDYNGKPWLIARDGSTVFTAVRYHPYSRRPYEVSRLFLSTDGETSWQQLNFPACFKAFDAYPDTPKLTLLKDLLREDGTIQQSPFIRWIDVISSDENGSIQLFIISGRGGFLRATIKSPS